MFRNNFKTAFRSLLKNKGFALLNLTGLACGLTIFLLIAFYVTDEFAFDRYNVNAERIFRVNTDTRFGGTTTSRAIAAPVIAGVLLKTFPEIETAVRLLPSAERIKKGNELVFENKCVYSDPSIFRVFTLPLVTGNPETLLTAPHTAVVTESIAKKYFNSTNIIGQVLEITGDDNRSTAYTITGVIQDMPEQSHFRFDFFLSMAGMGISRNTQFNALFPFSTYILLKPGANYQKLETKLPGFVRKNFAYYDEMEKSGDYLKINLTPLTNIHLQSNRTNELGNNGSLQYMYIFSAIAIFIILIACINFMNLSTARSASRAREVGVRKVLGSTRRNLISQFLCESFIITFTATIIAMLVTWALLPFFNQLSGKHLVVTRQILAWLLPSLIAVIAVVAAMAGAYPAFFLSGYQPIHVLKGRMSGGFKAGKFRNLLVVFQFAVSIFLIIGTLVIYDQLRYIQNKSLGFNRNQVIVIKNMNLLNNKAVVLKQEISQLPGVTSATLSSFLPTGTRRWINYVSLQKDFYQTEFWPVDENYIRTMDMKLVKGRDFSSQLLTDSSAIIINESAAKMFGIFNDPLNKTIYYGNREKEYHVAGVVKDFNFSSLRDNISPVVMMLLTPFEKRKQGDGAENLCIRAAPGNFSALLAQLENKWTKIAANQHFDYSFMDDDFDALYCTEQQMAKLFVIFTTLAILIACLGLFGLAAFSAEQRSKEISVRKVLGANVSIIVSLLTKDFIQLVIVSIIIATPIAWWAMHKWLQGFAYRINVHWWILAGAALAAIVIAFVTISFQSIKAASANPVKNLRNE